MNIFPLFCLSGDVIWYIFDTCFFYHSL
jgi:hypothetical protein